MSEEIEGRMLSQYPWLRVYIEHREKLEQRCAEQWALLVDLRDRLKRATAAGVESWPEYKRLCEMDPP